MILAGFAVPHPPLIVPAVGRGNEEQIRETTLAYEQVAEEVARLAPETIIITSPHAVMYADYFCISSGKRAKGSFAPFRAGGVSFEETYDEELVDEICLLADAEDFPAGTLGQRQRELDHGTMVPLWFIRNRYAGGRIVRIGLSALPFTEHYRLGMIIKEAAERLNRRVVWIASGDLSHMLKEDGPYGLSPEGPEYDARIMDVLGRASFGELFDFSTEFCEKAAECGHRSFVIMAGAFDGRAVQAQALSHQDVTGVGYGICTFYPGDEDPERHFLAAYLKKQREKADALSRESDAYVKLARQSLTSYILERKKIRVPDDLPEEMIDQKAGAFVSIHKHGQLRGCIGTILPVRGSVAEEIIENAISASTRDPRFAPISAEELPWLEIKVDVLGALEEIASEEELDVKRYGVIVSSGAKKGLLLPDLEGVDTVEEQISIAMQKAGIRKGEKIRLERFEVIRHH